VNTSTSHYLSGFSQMIHAGAPGDRSGTTSFGTVQADRKCVSREAKPKNLSGPPSGHSQGMHLRQLRASSAHQWHKSKLHYYFNFSLLQRYVRLLILYPAEYWVKLKESAKSAIGFARQIG